MTSIQSIILEPMSHHPLTIDGMMLFSSSSMHYDHFWPAMAIIP